MAAPPRLTCLAGVLVRLSKDVDLRCADLFLLLLGGAGMGKTPFSGVSSKPRRCERRSSPLRKGVAESFSVCCGAKKPSPMPESSYAAFSGKRRAEPERLRGSPPPKKGLGLEVVVWEADCIWDYELQL